MRRTLFHFSSLLILSSIHRFGCHKIYYLSNYIFNIFNYIIIVSVLTGQKKSVSGPSSFLWDIIISSFRRHWQPHQSKAADSAYTQNKLPIIWPSWASMTGELTRKYVHTHIYRFNYGDSVNWKLRLSDYFCVYIQLFHTLPFPHIHFHIQICCRNAHSLNISHSINEFSLEYNYLTIFLWVLADCSNLQCTYM